MAAGRNQSDFANDLDLSMSMVSKIETGEKEVSPKIIEKIITKYQVPEDWLVSGKGEMKFIKPISAHSDPWKDEAYQEVKAERNRLLDDIQFFKEIIRNSGGGFLNPVRNTGT
jgi:transcriptional regulator with XRE-family HTH domain